MFQPEAECLINDLTTLKIFFDPMRTRIMRAMANTPRTVQAVATELGVPFTRLYYHVNMLEKHGLIRMVETRTLSGAVEEKFYQVAARQFVVDRKLLSPSDGGSSEGLELLLDSVLTQTTSDIRKSVDARLLDLNTTSPDPNALLLRRGMVAMSAERASYFHQRILALLEEISSEEGGPDDRYYAIVTGLYPSNLPYEESSDDES